mmetsp:Transcript_32945/g.87654  ORF Transcript_32945/g.87654 Transcript_32945/m.87654 type:complete len:216 (+) Transcript_32945:338-985(+)
MQRLSERPPCSMAPSGGKAPAPTTLSNHSPSTAAELVSPSATCARTSVAPFASSTMATGRARASRIRRRSQTCSVPGPCQLQAQRPAKPAVSPTASASRNSRSNFGLGAAPWSAETIWSSKAAHFRNSATRIEASTEAPEASRAQVAARETSLKSGVWPELRASRKRRRACTSWSAALLAQRSCNCLFKSFALPRSRISSWPIFELRPRQSSHSS